METGEITRLLAELRHGNTDAQSRLASVVYKELHRLAERYMRAERKDHSMQATVLVHDAFLRLVAESDRTWENRTHFFAAAAQVMRHLLIDYARHRRAEKRGGGQAKLPLDEVAAISYANCEEWLAVDEALHRLAARDERLARIVEMRFFGGLTEDEIGEALGLSSRTIKRDWKVARAWLRADLAGIATDD
jgi:RNA polymerase sigma factor (TIGR02999 family)